MLLFLLWFKPLEQQNPVTLMKNKFFVRAKITTTQQRAYKKHARIMEIASIPYNINVNAPQKCLHAQAQIKCNALTLSNLKLLVPNQTKCNEIYMKKGEKSLNVHELNGKNIQKQISTNIRCNEKNINQNNKIFKKHLWSFVLVSCWVHLFYQLRYVPCLLRKEYVCWSGMLNRNG